MGTMHTSISLGDDDSWNNSCSWLNRLTPYLLCLVLIIYLPTANRAM
jgi:hypothetical protein